MINTDLDKATRISIESLQSELTALKAENEKWNAMAKCNGFEIKGLLAVGERLIELEQENERLRKFVDAYDNWAAKGDTREEIESLFKSMVDARNELTDIPKPFGDTDRCAGSEIY